MTRSVVAPLLSALGAAAGLTGACGGDDEPCEYAEPGSFEEGETPFESGAHPFSPCEDCPPDMLDGSAVTHCALWLPARGTASAVCLYGPDGTATQSDAEVWGIERGFDYCLDRCPGRRYLHACAVVASREGVTEVSCDYGRVCE